MTKGAMTMTYATLRDQIAALQAKRISAAELLEETIARIAKHDGKINAVIARDFEGARIAARKADRAPRAASANRFWARQ
jgi:amidase